MREPFCSKAMALEGENNAAMALDEANKRLFVVTRKPFKPVVLDTDTGRSIATLDAPKRTNELVFDRQTAVCT